MKDCSEKKSMIEKVIDSFLLKKELLLLIFVDKISSILSTFIGCILISILAIFSLLFLSLAIAFLIAKSLGSLFAGFFIMGSFYCSLSVIGIVFRKKLFEKPLIDVFIRKLLHKRNETL